jgi:hypothetical protein
MKELKRIQFSTITIGLDVRNALVQTAIHHDTLREVYLHCYDDLNSLSSAGLCVPCRIAFDEPLNLGRSPVRYVCSDATCWSFVRKIKKWKSLQTDLEYRNAKAHWSKHKHVVYKKLDKPENPQMPDSPREWRRQAREFGVPEDFAEGFGFSRSL